VVVDREAIVICPFASAEQGGLELGAGLWHNELSPEQASANLREASPA
jgi:hypothetical protein